MKILARIDVSQVRTKGEHWLYETLQQLKKPVFEPDERIVFFLHETDVTSYNSTIGDLEKLLDSFLDSVDIPQFFVIKEFTAGVSHVSSKDITCIYPWMHFYAGPSGIIKPCCLASGDFGNIAQYDTFEKVANSAEMKDLRKTMLNGQWSESCKICKDAEDATGSSYRTRATHYFSDHLGLIADTHEDGSIDNFKMRFYDIRLSNLCNFKCRTCGSEFSSSIAAEEGISSPLFRTRFREQYDNIFKQVIDNIDDIESFYFAGGEPLLMAEHYKILDALLEASKTKVWLHYNSNFSTLTFKGKHISEWWNKFERVTVGMSLDDQGNKAGLLRNGTDWATIVDNINAIRKLSPHVELQITSTISTYNCLSIMDFHKDAIEKLQFDPGLISVNPAMGDMNDLQILPPDIKDKVVEKINEFIKWIEPLPRSHDLVSRYQYSMKLMNAADRSYLWRKFKNRVKAVDTLRGEDTSKIFEHIT